MPNKSHGFPLGKTIALCQYIDMVCIYCGNPTQVTNSRHQKQANSVWRRRKCSACVAIFTTIEQPDLAQAITVRRTTHLEPFQRDLLFVSVYESLRHRKSALDDATAITNTIISLLRPFIQQGTLEIEHITEVAASTLDNFDVAAATHYRAFHP